MNRGLVIPLVVLAVLAALFSACREGSAPEALGPPAEGSATAPLETPAPLPAPETQLQTVAPVPPAIAEAIPPAPQESLTPAPPPPETPWPSPAPQGAPPSPGPTVTRFPDDLPATIPQTGVGPAAPAPTPTPLPPIFSDEEFRQIALKYISDTYGVAATELRAGRSVAEHFPLTSVTIRTGTFDNTLRPNYKREDHRTWVISLDSNKKVVDREGVIRAEEAGRKAKYGKLDPTLYDLIQAKGPEDLIKVSINIGGPAFDARLAEFWQGIRNKYTEALLNRYARPSERTPTNLWIEKIDPEVRNGEARIRTEIERPIIDYLKGLGYEASPGITAVIPKKILPELEKRPDVALINPYAVTVATLNYASPSDSAPTQWQKGVTGTWEPLGIVDNGSIDPAHQYLNVVVMRPGPLNDHPAQVAGVAASRRPLFRGIAKDTIIASADWTDYKAATDAVMSVGAYVINFSGAQAFHGQFTEGDRYYDKIVRWDRRSVAVAAGDNPPSVYDFVTSPGLGYNTISVGGYDDLDGLMWKGDKMWDDALGRSPYRDPETAGKQHEKPDVAAPAAGIWSLSNRSSTNPPWVMYAGSGTSLAAPAVTGTIGLMFARSLSLKDKPEAVRAAIMASAIHNIHGISTSNGDSPDDQDGQGGINTDVAVRIAEKTPGSGLGWEFADLDMNADFTGGWWNNSISFSGGAGKRIRAAITWDSEVAQAYTDTTLSTKLWLWVYKNGIPWKSSVSTFDSFQIIDEYAPEDATYTIYVWKQASTEEQTR